MSSERQTVTIELAGVSRQVEIYKNGNWSPWRANCTIFCKFPSGKVLHRVGQPVVYDNGKGWAFSLTQHVCGYTKLRAEPVAWDGPSEVQGGN